jgi:hypothetical protein
LIKKILLKETKNPTRYYNFVITNLKFQAKKISSFKNPHTKFSPLLCLDMRMVEGRGGGCVFFGSHSAIFLCKILPCQRGVGNCASGYASTQSVKEFDETASKPLQS